MLKKIRISLPRFYSVILSMSFLGTIFAPGIVFADQYTQQIQNLQIQNSQVTQNISSLQVQANNYQQAVNNLQGQISVMQTQITNTQNQISSTQAKIAANQILLAQQKNTLANIMQSMYVDGHMTTLESLATSQNMSDFVTKIEYQNIVQQQIQGDLNTINQTQLTLNQQNHVLSETLATLDIQNNQLSSEEGSEANLLAMTQQAQTAYTQQLQANNTQMAQLQAEEAQAIANAERGSTIVLGGACDPAQGDTYPEPWCGSSMDSMLDSWGMYNRECVSYAAWKVAESGAYMPYWGGVGDAYQWIGDAEASGIPVSSTPKAGDVAILPKGPYSPLGHAMYVESVNSNGTINISQYNANNNGDFSIAYNVNPSSMEFINFSLN